MVMVMLAVMIAVLYFVLTLWIRILALSTS